MSDEAKDALGNYLAKRHDEDKALFVKELRIKNQESSGDKEESAGRLTSRQMERIVQEAGKRAGIVKQVTPHVLRHSFATDMLRGGADLRSVQSLHGHVNVTTTQVYTHVTDKHLKEIHEKYHNKAKSKTQNV
jgi:site-specific recombinase XerD